MTTQRNRPDVNIDFLNVALTHACNRYDFHKGLTVPGLGTPLRRAMPYTYPVNQVTAHIRDNTSGVTNTLYSTAFSCKALPLVDDDQGITLFGGFYIVCPVEHPGFVTFYESIIDASIQIDIAPNHSVGLDLKLSGEDVQGMALWVARTDEKEPYAFMQGSFQMEFDIYATAHLIPPHLVSAQSFIHSPSAVLFIQCTPGFIMSVLRLMRTVSIETLLKQHNEFFLLEEPVSPYESYLPADPNQLSSVRLAPRALRALGSRPLEYSIRMDLWQALMGDKMLQLMKFEPADVRKIITPWASIVLVAYPPNAFHPLLCDLYENATSPIAPNIHDDVDVYVGRQKDTCALFVWLLPEIQSRLR